MALLEIAIVVLGLVIAYLLYKNLEWRFKFERKVKDWIEAEEERIREDAISRSARTLSGKTLEKLVPFLDKFSYDPHDIRWMGDPIDFVIFHGNSDGSPKEIVFCEIKSGKSFLSRNQRKIKELVEGRKVRWYEFRI
ncbi:MAG: hypothetical protein HYT70_00080 [Candidatus Aenigmarchaeota archaeon]|nr:hypothetical protein [Candidatus Aenigmarchaeota archaeon]